MKQKINVAPGDIDSRDSCTALVLVVAVCFLAIGCGGSGNASPGLGSTTPPSVVQVASFVAPVGQNSSYSATFAHPVTAGDSIAAVFWWNYGIGWTISSVGDDKNDPFEQAFRLAIDENYSAWTYLSTNVSGGATTVTVQVSNANADQFAIAILEVKGATGVDQTNGPNSASCNGLSTLCSSLPVTTKHPNELILGFGVINVTGVVTPSSIMAGQGFTEQFASDFFAVETEPVTSVGSYQATLTVPSGSEYWGDVGIVTIY